MIRSLTGKITEVGASAITIDVRGVGYRVGATTKTTLYTMGEELTIYTHLAVRETAMDLYGFLTLSELDIFELLLSVPKIGPKSALQILNQASPSLLVESISNKDSAHLHKLSGIGKKTCENVVLHLQDKLEGIGIDTPTTPQNTFGAKQKDAIDALVSLGYDLSTARETVQNLPSELSTNDIITRALKQIT
jgi:Holliday junction DNA helicase RuvA